MLKMKPLLRKNKEPTVVEVSLASILGIDLTNSSELTIKIIDDLPTNISFENNIGVSTNKNFFLSSLNKLFINPKSLIDGTKVLFSAFQKHVEAVERKLRKEEIKLNCTCKKKQFLPKHRLTFIQETDNACCSKTRRP